MAHTIQITLCIFIIIILPNLITTQRSGAYSGSFSLGPTKKKIYNCSTEDTNRDDVCNKLLKHSTCIAGKCECSSPTFQYKEECQLGPGWICSPAPDAPSCGKLASCKDGSCICNGPYEVYTGARCDKDYGEPCTDFCNYKLLCLNNTCKCRDGSLFDKKYARCRGFVGHSCEEDLDCNDGAECSYFKRYCQCQDGYILSKERTCLPDHGKECREHTDPNLPFYTCPDFKNLVCRDQKCICDSKFTLSGDSCVGKLGGECGKNVEYILSGNPNFTIEERPDFNLCEWDKTCLESNNTCVSRCLSNACCGKDTLFDQRRWECKVLVGSRCNKTRDCSEEAECSQNGLCQCREGYILSKDRTCFPGYRKFCREDTNPGSHFYRCADFKNLVCRRQRCECDSKLTYKNETGTCEGRDSGASGAVQLCPILYRMFVLTYLSAVGLFMGWGL